MPIKIRPKPVKSWPKLFWERAADSVSEDLLCPECGSPGQGCDRCRGSGLIVPLREGARSLDDLDWPEVPWLWVAGPSSRCRVFAYTRCEDNVLGFVLSGRIVFGLFRQTENAQDQLRRAYRDAFGGRAVPEFVLPWLE